MNAIVWQHIIGYSNAKLSHNKKTTYIHLSFFIGTTWNYWNYPRLTHIFLRHTAHFGSGCSVNCL
jgi:hypothetical protein